MTTVEKELVQRGTSMARWYAPIAARLVRWAVYSNHSLPRS